MIESSSLLQPLSCQILSSASVIWIPWCLVQWILISPVKSPMQWEASWKRKIANDNFSNPCSHCALQHMIFWLCIKYVKGDRKEFCHHSHHYHKWELLVAIQRMKGLCNDAIMEGACATYYNWWLYVDHLMEKSKWRLDHGESIHIVFLTGNHLTHKTMSHHSFSIIPPMPWLAGTIDQ